jgi:hypothetical protein
MRERSSVQTYRRVMSNVLVSLDALNMLDMAPLVRSWTRLLAWGGVGTVVDIICSAAWDGFSLWLFDVRMRLTLRQLVRFPL